MSGGSPDADEVVRKVAEERAAKMRRASCTEHQRAPDVRVVKGAGEYVIEASFCCEPAKERAMRAVRSKTDTN